MNILHEGVMLFLALCIHVSFYGIDYLFIGQIFVDENIMQVLKELFYPKTKEF